MPALGTNWRLRPLLQPPKLPHSLELGGCWHGLSHPVGSQGLAPAAGAAGAFHEDAPLQPAHPLCRCCSPAAQSLLLLGSLPSPACELLGRLCSGALLGTGGCPLSGPRPAGDARSCTQEPLGVRADARPGLKHTHPTLIPSRGLPQHPPLAAVLPSLPARTSSSKLCSWCDTACPDPRSVSLQPLTLGERRCSPGPSPPAGKPSRLGCSPHLTLCPQVHSLQELRRSASLATKVFVQRDYSDGTTCQFQTKFPPELESRVGSLRGCQGWGDLWGLRGKKGIKVWGLMGCCMALGQPVLLGL